jgi:hypothetical protein
MWQDTFISNIHLSQTVISISHKNVTQPEQRPKIFRSSMGTLFDVLHYNAASGIAAPNDAHA